MAAGSESDSFGADSGHGLGGDGDVVLLEGFVPVYIDDATFAEDFVVGC